MPDISTASSQDQRPLALDYCSPASAAPSNPLARTALTVGFLSALAMILSFFMKDAPWIEAVAYSAIAGAVIAILAGALGRRRAKLDSTGKIEARNGMI